MSEPTDIRYIERSHHWFGCHVYVDNPSLGSRLRGFLTLSRYAWRVLLMPRAGW